MPQARDDHAISAPRLLYTRAAIVFYAALFGIGSGGLMAYLAPIDKFSWAGLAIAPLWLVLEICFEGIATIASSARLRTIATIVAMAGFYSAWIWLRP